MKILLVGGGAVGSVISHYLSKDSAVSKIVCGSKDIKLAKEFVGSARHKVKLVKLNASNIGEIADAARGAHLIINASLPRFNENILEAALRVGAHYQDLASDLVGYRVAEQLKFNKRFQRAGRIALINSGVAPGITNLLAREAADKLSTVDEIRFRCLEEQRASEFIFAWSAETTLDDITAPPLIYRNGKFALTKPFEGSEDVEFPHPFGKRRVFSLYGDEVATIPLFIKVKNVDFKSGGTDIEFSKALSRLGFFSKKPVIVEGRKVTPLEFFKKISPPVPTPRKMRQLVRDGIIESAALSLVVEVIGKKQNRNMRIRMSATFPDLKKIQKTFPGATYISYPTGTAAYSFSKIIPYMNSGGVFPPEALDNEMRKIVMLNLKKNGVAITHQLQKK